MLLKTSEVAERLRITRAALYKLKDRDPTFPRPFMVGNRAPRFEEAEIEAWIASKRAGGEESRAA